MTLLTPSWLIHDQQRQRARTLCYKRSKQKHLFFMVNIFKLFRGSPSPHSSSLNIWIALLKPQTSFRVLSLKWNLCRNQQFHSNPRCNDSNDSCLLQGPVTAWSVPWLMGGWERSLTGSPASRRSWDTSLTASPPPSASWILGKQSSSWEGSPPSPSLETSSSPPPYL